MTKRLPKEAYIKNARIYRVLANPKRLEILNLLRDGEMGVEDILKITKIAKANLSQHFTILKKNGLIKNRREGLYIFYTLIDPRVIEPCKILHKLRLNKIVS